MLANLLSRATRRDPWNEARARVERVSARLFTSIGTSCTARAFTVPSGNDSLLLIELRSDVQWTSESIRTAKAILLQALNSELGFRLKPDDLLVAFAEGNGKVSASRRPPVQKSPDSDFQSSVVVTEVGSSEWSAFGPTDAGALHETITSASSTPRKGAASDRAKPAPARRGPTSIPRSAGD